MASITFASGTLITSTWLNDVNGVVWTLFGGATTAAGGRTALGLGTLAVLNAPLSAASGGTGIANNAASTLTISGSFATTLTITGATGVTLPTSGTLATLAGSETLTNKALNGTLGSTSPAAATVTSLIMNSYSAGTWTAQTYNAGDFTGNVSMTWTVASGDDSTLAYTIISKTMIIAFSIVTSTVGGTPANTLQITIPAGKTVVTGKNFYNACFLTNNGIQEIGFVTAGSGATVIGILRPASATWTAGADNVAVQGQITFEIQ